MRTWECLFAPSITERYLVRALGRLLRPIARLFGRVRLPFMRQMDAIHQLGMNEPEEDFLALLPVNACFLVVVLFPEEASLWRLVRFDAAMPEPRKATLMRFYRRMIQKHLYFHGAKRRYLCKNPSFALLAGQPAPDLSGRRLRALYPAGGEDAAVPAQLVAAGLAAVSRAALHSGFRATHCQHAGRLLPRH